MGFGLNKMNRKTLEIMENEVVLNIMKNAAQQKNLLSVRNY